ncbi:hypothetical protein SeLEV6574_g08182, partial [Synchytrium endobioticum]
MDPTRDALLKGIQFLIRRCIIIKQNHSSHSHLYQLHNHIATWMDAGSPSPTSTEILSLLPDSYREWPARTQPAHHVGTLIKASKNRDHMGRLCQAGVGENNSSHPIHRGCTIRRNVYPPSSDSDQPTVSGTPPDELTAPEGHCYTTLQRAIGKQNATAAWKSFAVITRPRPHYLTITNTIPPLILYNLLDLLHRDRKPELVLRVMEYLRRHTIPLTQSTIIVEIQAYRALSRWEDVVAVYDGAMVTHPEIQEIPEVVHDVIYAHTRLQNYVAAKRLYLGLAEPGKQSTALNGFLQASLDGTLPMQEVADMVLQLVRSGASLSPRTLAFALVSLARNETSYNLVDELLSSVNTSETKEMLGSTHFLYMLLLAYRDAGMLDKAEQVFDAMNRKKRPSSGWLSRAYSAMMKSYSEQTKPNVDIQKMEALMEEMVTRKLYIGIHVYSIMISSIGSMKPHPGIRKMRSYYHQMLKAGIEPNEYVINAMVYGYKRAGFGFLALMAFRRHIRKGYRPNLRILTSVASLYADRGNYCKVIETFNLVADKSALNRSTDAATADSNRLGVSITSDTSLRTDDYLPSIPLDVPAYSTLIQAYCKANRIEVAVSVYNHMKASGLHPDLITYTTLMNGLSESKQLEQAYKLLEDMRSQNIHPDSLVATALVRGYVVLNDAAGAWRIMKELKLSGLEVHESAYTMLVKAYQDSPEDALAVVETAIAAGVPVDVPMYVAVMHVMLKANRPLLVLACYESMIKRQMVPNANVCDMSLRAACQRGKSANVEQILERMKTDRIKMFPLTLEILVKAILDARIRLDVDAKGLVRKPPRMVIQRAQDINYLVNQWSNRGVHMSTRTIKTLLPDYSNPDICLALVNALRDDVSLGAALEMRLTGIFAVGGRPDGIVALMRRCLKDGALSPALSSTFIRSVCNRLAMATGSVKDLWESKSGGTVSNDTTKNKGVPWTIENSLQGPAVDRVIAHKTPNDNVHSHHQLVIRSITDLLTSPIQSHIMRAKGFTARFFEALHPLASSGLVTLDMVHTIQDVWMRHVDTVEARRAAVLGILRVYLAMENSNEEIVEFLTRELGAYVPAKRTRHGMLNLAYECLEEA